MKNIFAQIEETNFLANIGRLLLLPQWQSLPGFASLPASSFYLRLDLPSLSQHITEYSHRIHKVTGQYWHSNTDPDLILRNQYSVAFTV